MHRDGYVAAGLSLGARHTLFRTSPAKLSVLFSVWTIFLPEFNSVRYFHYSEMIHPSGMKLYTYYKVCSATANPAYTPAIYFHYCDVLWKSTILL